MRKPGYDNPFVATAIALRDRLRPHERRRVDPHDRLDGRTVLVTGANRGLGLGVARGLAELGARLILAGRSDTSEIELEARARGADVLRLSVDLADLRSVSALADDLAARGETIHVAVLNAGVVPNRARRTVQGLELQFGVNFLANVKLVDRLLADGVIPNATFGGTGASDPRARIVAISSESHRSATDVSLERFGEFEPYGIRGVMPQYSHTKLLLTAWAMELARRARRGGEVDVAVHAMCPGPVRSGIAREAPGWSQPLLDPIMKTFFAPADEAAHPVLHLAASRALEGRSGIYMHRWEATPPSDLARDEGFGRRLWDASHALLERLEKDEERS